MNRFIVREICFRSGRATTLATDTAPHVNPHRLTQCKRAVVPSYSRGAHSRRPATPNPTSPRPPVRPSVHPRRRRRRACRRRSCRRRSCRRRSCRRRRRRRRRCGRPVAPQLPTRGDVYGAHQSHRPPSTHTHTSGRHVDKGGLRTPSNKTALGIYPPGLLRSSTHSFGGIDIS